MSQDNAKSIANVLSYIKQRGGFAGFERYEYKHYDINSALQVVEAIGRSRNPKFVIDDENRFAYTNFIKWCHGDTTMRALNPLTGQEQAGDLNRGIYIAGNTGSGKSWCLEIMLAYSQAMGFVICFDDGDGEVDKPLFWGITRADDICNEYIAKGEIQLIKKRAMIGIQDLGQEPKEVLYMGNRLNVLQQLLEYRGDRTDQLTLITSNLRISSDTLKRDYGDRVQSRLVEMCNYFEIKGKDRRKY